MIENKFFKNIAPLKNKDFSKISTRVFKNITLISIGFFLLVFFYLCFEIYVPLNPASQETITYSVQKGWGDEEIGDDLQKIGIIRSSYFFKFYVILTLKHGQLKAGEYSLSTKLSIYEIATKMAQGDVIRDRAVIVEGWGVKDIGGYLEKKDICNQDYFIALTKKDYSGEFSFLKDKAKNVGLEGYIFPDTYEVGRGETCEDILTATLDNFDKKLTSELRTEIVNQKKTIFDIIIMASMIEKEVRGIEDKKIVSGILWKRIAIDMPLQLDATVNYATGKSDASVTIKDTKIDSPYNTYKYYGLPKGPISNPGIESIMAAIYPTKSNYWFYLTNDTTIFSETLSQHNEAIEKYLNR